MKSLSILSTRLIVWLLIITIFSSFLVGIIPLDHLHVSEKNYLLIGIGLISIIICISYIFSEKNLTFKVLGWEILLVAFGIYLFIRHKGISDITFYNSSATYYLLLIWAYFICKHIISSNQKLLIDIAFGICSLTIFQVIYGYLQLLNILPISIGAYKLEGTLLNPGVYANFISLGIIVCIGSYWFLNVGKLGSVFLITTAVLGLSILPFANARTAWIAIFAGLFYMAYFRFNLKARYLSWANTSLRKWLIPLTVILLSVFIGWFLYSYKVDSSNGRILIWKVCFQLIKQNPIWGIGTNCFANEYSYAQIEYLRNPAIDFSTKMLADRAISAFNEYLQLTVELGFFGLFLFLSLILLPFKKFFNKKSTKEIHPFIAAIIAFLIMALFSYPFHNASILIAFISIAAINSFKNQKKIILINRTFVSKMIVYCALVLSFIIVYKGSNYYIFCRKWKTTFINQKTQIDKKVTLSKYEELYPSLNKNFDFLYNYASILKYYGEYDKAIEFYQKSGTYYLDHELLIEIAGCYYNLGKYDKAEKFCKDAINLIPYLFVPKYRLFLLYKKTNRDKQALELAKEIYDMPIKVYSDKVKEIKLNVKEYIDKTQKT